MTSTPEAGSLAIKDASHGPPHRAAGNLSPWKTIVKREVQTALLNRFVPIFSAATLAVGLAPLFGDHPGESAPYFLVQAILYLIPLFALLIGVGAAQGDIEERPFLFSQPVSRLTMVAGKWVALWGIILLAATLLTLPSALGDTPLAPLGLLWISTLETGGTFLALGLAVGFSTNDRVKAHLAILCAWLLLLAGFDLLALLAAQAGLFHQTPTLWLLLLMLNPLAAFRIGALFSLGQVPLDVTQIPVPGQWWLAHPLLWLTLLSAGWTGALLAWCRFRLHRMEA